MPIHWPHTKNQGSDLLRSAPIRTPCPTPKSRANSLRERTLNQKYRGWGWYFTASLLLLLPLRLPAQTPPPSPKLDPALDIQTLPLYNGPVPNAKGTTPEDTPTLTVFRPLHPNGTAVIVVPGGAYIHLASNHEGRQEADRLAELGVTAFVLKYRLGPTYLYPVPLDDARRAVRLVRSLAPTYGFSPDHIGMMGFSAGGHLAATAAALPTPATPSAPDPVDRQPSNLNFEILIYPWLNAMQPQVPSYADPSKLLINYCSVTKGLTQTDCTRLDPQYTPLHHISATTPPTFIVHTADDNTVPVTTSLEFYAALQKLHADAELHVFAHGPHGFGTGADTPELYVWQDLLANWLRAHNLLTPAATTH